MAQTDPESGEGTTRLRGRGQRGGTPRGRPERPRGVGLYSPQHEHDSCGVGFVAHVKGKRSHQIVRDAEHLLCRMDHRGARGAEPNTGDGAGILTALPHEFLARVFKEEFGTDLPAPGGYGAGVVFLPTDAEARERCKQIVAEICTAEGQRLVGWRKVPVDPDGADLGPTAREAAPHIEQVVIAGDNLAGDALERKLYLIRKQASQRLRGDARLDPEHTFYVCSLSTQVLIYKGMLIPGQVTKFFLDLNAPDYTSHLAMVHSRFSTNTFPSWDRAQPNRFMSHNGEINTLRGNINWMRAREGVLESELFGDDLEKLFPVVEPDCSDSGTFDNVLEFLLMTGRTLQEAVMMMVPEAWQKNELMPTEKRAFYEYHSCMMEPWDGPASIAFTDGKYIGAVLDRNGLQAEPLLPDPRRSRHHGERGRCAAGGSGHGQGQGAPRARQNVPDRFRARTARARRRAEARVRVAPSVREVAQGAAPRIAGSASGR